MRGTLVFRARVLCVLFILAAVVLILRLYFVQIVRGESYAADAMGQYVQRAGEEVSRGDILFTTKDGESVAAAVTQSGWRLVIVPKDIMDAAATYDLLNPHVEIDSARFFASAAKAGDPWEDIRERVGDEAASAIRALKLPGVVLVQDKWRKYPGGALAAQVLGFVGYKGDQKTGVYGLERQWQDTLSHTKDGLYVNPFAEIFTNVQAALASDVTKHEGSIVTTIDPAVQTQVEKTLEEVSRSYAPRTAGAIVMDPKTGKIVAMAVRPTFDPNTYNTVDDPAVFSNPLVEGRYELGSIMKPLTMAIGIDAGAVTPKTTYHDAGCFSRSGKTICNHDKKPRNTATMQQILSESLNLGATFVEERTGSATFTRYMKSLGLDAKTGIDLPNEVTGDLSPLGNGTGPEVNFAAASFGQGISVSPIAMTRALSALANGGRLPNPRIVSHVKFANGITRVVEDRERVQVFKPETAEEVTRMLTEVFDKALLEGKLKQERYSIAAKTGTAQLVNPAGGYYADRYLHSFFGYFPAHDARFIVFIFAVDPKGATFASATLARPFLDIGKFLMNYYSIPPDR
jgi:cell division protein FtsI/penicillin-binding protein 2